jgi:transcription elongation factor GreA
LLLVDEIRCVRPVLCVDPDKTSGYTIVEPTAGYAPRAQLRLSGLEPPNIRGRLIELPDKIVLTRQGYQDIERELEELVTVKRPALVDRIREARQMGDLRENFDYEDAKRQQGLVEGRIAELKAIMAEATVIDSSGNNGSVRLGSKVRIKDLEDGFEEEYMIVGSLEASPSDGRISDESCIGAALMGAAAGDTVQVNSPGGVYKYQVLSIE